MKKSTLLYLIFFIFSGRALCGQAAVFNVTDVTQLQNTLTTAGSNSEDDNINIAAGTYTVMSTLTYTAAVTENFILTIEGAGADETILDGGNTNRILLINTTNLTDDSNAHISIKGLIFQEGSSGDGGGLYTRTNSADVKLEDSRFNRNSATGYGGGAYLNSSGGTATITNNIFSNNSADHRGGGTYVNGMETTILTANTFSNNSADLGVGGGIYADASWGTLILTKNTFTENASTGSAGGAYLDGSPHGVITATSNTFTSNSSGTWAGGAYVTGDLETVSFTNNTLSNNSASHLGGGLYFAPGRGTGTAANNTFIDNSADSGGGIYVDGHTSTTTLTNNVFNKNTSAQHGSGVYAYLNQFGTLNIINNSLSVNSTAGDGGGLYIFLRESNNTVNIYNNIIWANTAIGIAGDLYVNDDGDNSGIGGTVNLFNNDYSTFDIFDGDNLHHADNINEDPLLTANFHLQANSPCIDNGDNAAPSLPATDFEVGNRIMDGNGDSIATVDIGADEYVKKYSPWILFTPATVSGGQ